MKKVFFSIGMSAFMLSISLSAVTSEQIQQEGINQSVDVLQKVIEGKNLKQIGKEKKQEAKETIEKKYEETKNRYIPQGLQGQGNSQTKLPTNMKEVTKSVKGELKNQAKQKQSEIEANLLQKADEHTGGGASILMDTYKEAKKNRQ